VARIKRADPLPGADVIRPNLDYRGFAGRSPPGRAPGDEVMVLALAQCSE
jgi:sulfate adenylyltransferase subunit 1 (EFTu-like GTPase family)